MRERERERNNASHFTKPKYKKKFRERCSQSFWGCRFTSLLRLLHKFIYLFFINEIETLFQVYKRNGIKNESLEAKQNTFHLCCRQ